MRTNPIFLVVKPLVENMKIEGLNLGRRIRNLHNARGESSLKRATSLKANLAKGELSVIQAMDLAKRWESVFKTKGWQMSCAKKSINERDLDHGPNLLKFAIANVRRYAMKVKCEATDETSVICHLVHDQILQYVADFMANEALVQLVEIKPRYKVFNYWSRPILQVIIFAIVNSHVIIFFPRKTRNEKK